MTTKEMIAVMQASEEGKTIEYRISRISDPAAKDEWDENQAPAWNWSEYDYRVKPEPREIKIWCGPEGELGRFFRDGDDSYDPHGWKVRTFREVIE